MSPIQYRDSSFAKDKNAKRVWLDAKQVFSTSRAGSEDLSPEGRKQLDQAMAGFVEYLPNSPIMVEGYSSEGSPDDRFRKSQQRAISGQTYILQKYQLNPKYVGAMPLTDMPPSKAGKVTWDGVALVLIPAK